MRNLLDEVLPRAGRPSRPTAGLADRPSRAEQVRREHASIAGLARLKTKR